MQFSIPTAGAKVNWFSRSDILTDVTPTAFGSDQSMDVATDGESPSDPTTWPTWVVLSQGQGTPTPRSSL